MRNTRSGVVCALLVALAATTPAWGQITEGVPQIDQVTMTVSRYVGDRSFATFDFNWGGSVFDPFFGFFDVFALWSAPIPFDPTTDVANELDIVDIELQVSDTDLEDGTFDIVIIGGWPWFVPSAEEFFYQLRATAGFTGPPEAPPMPGATLGYSQTVVTQVTPPPDNTVLMNLSLYIPEILGVNQDRLRGFQDWDVFWTVEIRVANSESPEGTDPDNPQSGDFDQYEFTLFAAEKTTLRPPNAPPVANAGVDQTVDVNSTVILDGSDTYDGTNVGFDPFDDDVFEKDTLLYFWEWITGPERVDPVAVDDDNPATAAVTLTQTGTYEYRLLVEDGVNPAPSTDSMLITVVTAIAENNAPTAVVQAVAPNGETAGAGETLIGTVGDEVTLDGSQSTDPDGDELSYHWRQTNALGESLSTTEYQESFLAIDGIHADTATWTATEARSYYFTLMVTDPDGLSHRSGILRVQVNEASTAGDSAFRDEAASPTRSPDGDAGSAELGSNDPPAGMPFCGGGLLPLTVLPVAFWLMRGRVR